MKGANTVGIDIDSSSFASGWTTAAAFFTAIGVFVRKIIMKATSDQLAAKDEEISLLIKRVEHLERDNAVDHARCESRIDTLNTRIAVLEAMTLGRKGEKND